MRKAIIGMGLVGLLGCSEPPVEAKAGIEERYDSMRESLAEVYHKSAEDRRKAVSETIYLLEIEDGTGRNEWDFLRIGSSVVVGGLDYGAFDVEIRRRSYAFEDHIAFRLKHEEDGKAYPLKLLSIGLSSTSGTLWVYDRGGSEVIDITLKTESTQLLYRKLLLDSPALLRGKTVEPDQEFVAAYQALRDQHLKK